MCPFWPFRGEVAERAQCDLFYCFTVLGLPSASMITTEYHCHSMKCKQLNGKPMQICANHANHAVSECRVRVIKWVHFAWWVIKINLDLSQGLIFSVLCELRLDLLMLWCWSTNDFSDFPQPTPQGHNIFPNHHNKQTNGVLWASDMLQEIFLKDQWPRSNAMTMTMTNVQYNDQIQIHLVHKYVKQAGDLVRELSSGKCSAAEIWNALL